VLAESAWIVTLVAEMWVLEIGTGDPAVAAVISGIPERSLHGHNYPIDLAPPVGTELIKKLRRPRLGAAVVPAALTNVKEF
jgi:hypothetical protein